MAHHSSESSDELRRFFERGQNAQKAIDELTPQLGATGKFPEGKLVREDQGEIQVAIACVKDKVVIDFGKPVVWVGMTPQQAKEIGELLIERAGVLPGGG